MATADDLTTLMCLFHHKDQARAAVRDLVQGGISQSSISEVGNGGSEDMADDSLRDLGLPNRDCKHILEGLRKGGILIAVSAMSDQVDTVERVFGNHKAKLIDEADVAAKAAPLPDAEEAVIPIVEEQLVVGKRTVDQGSVRVYRRILEIPVDESIKLHEEHVNVQRHAVDRPVTDADLTFQGDRTIELIETAEEAVVGKTARVIEEITVGKNETERTEHIHDTVRRTEVEVEEVAPGSDSNARFRNT